VDLADIAFKSKLGEQSIIFSNLRTLSGHQLSNSKPDATKFDDIIFKDFHLLVLGFEFRCFVLNLVDILHPWALLVLITDDQPGLLCMAVVLVTLSAERFEERSVVIDPI